MSDKLMVLHHKCSKIEHTHINNIINTPELADAVRGYPGEYTDEVICNLVYDVARNTPASNPRFGEIQRAARLVFQDVHGTIPTELFINNISADEFPGYESVFEILEPLRPRSIRILLGNSEFLAAVDSHHPENFLQMYAVFKLVFFEMIRKQYKKKDEEKRNTYFGFRSVANDFCWVIFGDPTVWREQLQAKLS